MCWETASSIILHHKYPLFPCHHEHVIRRQNGLDSVCHRHQHGSSRLGLSSWVFHHGNLWARMLNFESLIPEYHETLVKAQLAQAGARVDSTIMTSIMKRPSTLLDMNDHRVRHSKRTREGWSGLTLTYRSLLYSARRDPPGRRRREEGDKPIRIHPNLT